MRTIVVLFSLFFFSCSSEEPESNCGSGESVTEGNEEVCLFTHPSMDQTCPSGYPEKLDYSGGAIVCANQRKVSGATLRKLQTLGYIPLQAVNNQNNKRNNKTNNNKTNNKTNNTKTETPTPVLFKLKYTAPIASTFYYQKRDSKNQIGWLNARKKGKQMMLSLPCGISECDKANATKCAPPTTEIFLDNSTSNEVEFSWDGYVYEEAFNCAKKIVPEANSDWVVEFCISPTVLPTNDGGSELNGAVKCVEESFVLGMHREVVSHFK